MLFILRLAELILTSHVHLILHLSKFFYVYDPALCFVQHHNVHNYE